LENTGAQIIGTVHDEIIIEVPEGVAGKAAVILKETMIQAGEAYLSKVPIEVEVTIGDSWGEK
jgi:DNA polymerase I-like protein with 3'-5' exonuclease and polymerase domains